jgi:hypothetical protein
VKNTTLLIMMISLSSGFMVACAANDAGSAGRAAQLVTAAIEQHMVGGDDDLCSRWTACYVGCAVMPCDDDATCTEQQAAYASCDTSNSPAADYCPLPG